MGVKSRKQREWLMRGPRALRQHVLGYTNGTGMHLERIGTEDLMTQTAPNKIKQAYMVLRNPRRPTAWTNKHVFVA